MRPMMRAMWHCSQLMHRLAHVAFGVCLIVCMVVTAGAWRLAQGPVDISWLTARARTALLDEASPVRVSFGSASLTWGGLGDRLEHVIELRIIDPVVADPSGAVVARAPRAWMTFSVPALLTGRFIPRAVEVDDAAITLPDDVLAPSSSSSLSDSRASLPLSNPLARLRSIVDQINGGRQGLVQLRRVHLRNARVVLPQPDRAPPIVISGIAVDLARRGAGHFHGSASAAFRLGDERGNAEATVDLLRGGNSRVALSVSPVHPAALSFVPEAAALDVPVGVEGSLTVDAGFALRAAQATLRFGAGGIHAGKGAIPIRRGRIDLAATADTVRITSGLLDVAPTALDPPSLLGVRGEARFGDRVIAALNLTLDNVNLAQLPLIWPPGVGGGARSWIAEHVLGGTATHGSAAFTAESDAGFRNVTLTKATGDLDGSDVTFTWLDTVPAIRQAAVHLHLIDPDSLDISIPAARQLIAGNRQDLLVENGLLHISGLTQRDQYADIHVRTDGTLNSALALLKEPRLRLLSAHPIGVDVDAGNAAAALDFQFNMQEQLTMDGVTVHARAHLTDVRLPAVVGGNALENGAFDLSITKDGMRMDGQGTLAATKVKLQGAMDFTAGPPTQVLQRVVVTGQPSVAALQSAGVDVSDWADGAMPMTVTVLDRRTGPETVGIEGDLTDTALNVSPLAWSKPPGEPARISAALALQRGHLVSIDRFGLNGDGLAVSGSARTTDGHVSSVTLTDLQLGRTRGRCTIQLAAGGPIGIVLTAGTVDLSAKLTEKTSKGQAVASGPPAQTPPRPPTQTPPWTLDARVEHVILANEVTAGNLVLKGRGDGEIVRTLDAVGTVKGGSAFAMSVMPKSGRRHLRIDAQDAGMLLRGLDVVRSFRSGHLAIDGWFQRPDHYSPLTGSAVIEGAELTRSPAVAKLLQAVTIYGLADVMRGPGLRFSKIDIPFTYDEGALTVRNARAYNASLGLTAQGRIGMHSDQIDADGTVVPAYFFNSILGGLPLVGKLFSPEKGGGVFAVAFGISGDLSDPRVTVNPVSALTPGILRNLFGAGNGSKLAQRPDGIAAGAR